MKDELIQIFAKENSVRFNYKQKLNYETKLDVFFNEMDYKKEIDEKRQTVFKTRNIIYGNLKMAKNVIVVPYDTPSRVFWHKYNYYPLDGNKTSTKSILPTYGPILIFYLFFLGFMYLAPLFVKSQMLMFIISFITFSLFLLLFLLLIVGYPNHNNDNRNSASVVAAIELAQRLTKEQRKTTAFVFTDRNENRFHGSKLVALRLKELSKNPNIILLNCIAYGKNLMIGFTSDNRKTAQDLIKQNKNHRSVGKCEMNDNMRFQNPMDHWKKAVLITAGNYDEKKNLVITNVNRKCDTIIEKENVDVIVDMLTNYIVSQ
ncbi:MAG: hypothetical protein RR863_01940 [Erysipelotrichaceae bacterium]